MKNKLDKQYNLSDEYIRVGKYTNVHSQRKVYIRKSVDVHLLASLQSNLF